MGGIFINYTEKVLEFYFGKLDVGSITSKVNLYLFVIGLVVFCLHSRI